MAFGAVLKSSDFSQRNWRDFARLKARERQQWITAMSRYIVKVRRALVDVAGMPYWCHTVSEWQWQATPTLSATFFSSLHSRLQVLRICLCEEIKNMRITWRKAMSQIYNLL